MRKIFLALSITLVLSLALGAGLAFAANTAAPGDTLFKLDRGLEALQKGLVRSELQPLAAQDDPQLLDEPVEDPEIEPEDPKDGAYCREGGKDKNHPTGEKLAGEFFDAGYFDGDVSIVDAEGAYEQVMGWFCGTNAEGSGHFGFGEIKLGYRIAAAAGLTPAEIFAMRAEGKGWGVILKDLGLSMKDVKPPKPPKLENGTSGNNGQGNAYGQDKEKGNNGQGNANGHDKNKENKGKKP